MIQASDNDKKTLMLALASLGRQVEQKERQQFDLSKGVAQIAPMLKLAMLSVNADVKSALKQVIDALTPQQKASLETHGVSFHRFKGAGKSLRDARLAAAFDQNPDKDDRIAAAFAQSSGNDEFQDDVVHEEQQDGKTKIVYRGQTKWV